LEDIPGIERFQVVQQSDFSIDVLLRSSRPNPEALFESARSIVRTVIGDELAVRSGILPMSAKHTTEKFRPVRSYAGSTPSRFDWPRR
jgi:hypothetical protein